MSDLYAPYGTCRKCGWSGHDWGFKYHGYCKKCHSQWRKEKAEERRRRKPPNENMELTEGLIITRNVRERLHKQAHSEVPRTRRLIWSNWCEGICLYISLISMFVLAFTVEFHPNYAPYLVTLAILGFIMAKVCERILANEETKRTPKVNRRLEELARKRQRKIDKTNAFYASSEWRFVREQVIKEQGHVCQVCGVQITNDCDLTVDHIKPRSKFPEFALDKSNLQVMCRKCNSAKGATYEEENITAQIITPS